MQLRCSPMHPLELGTSPVPGCCARAACLTITGATQLVVRVAAVLDQVLHIAMFNLRRLCTAPVCRQRMLSFPEDPAQNIAPGSGRSLPSPVLPAPCLLPAKLSLASSEPQCSHPCPGRYRRQLQSPAQSRPGQQSAALQVCREEKAHSVEKQPGEVTWAIPGPYCCGGCLQCWDPERFSPNTAPATAHCRARSSARQGRQTQHRVCAGTCQQCSPHACSSLSSQQPPLQADAVQGSFLIPFIATSLALVQTCVLPDLLTCCMQPAPFPAGGAQKAPPGSQPAWQRLPGSLPKPPWEASVPRVSGILQLQICREGSGCRRWCPGAVTPAEVHRKQRQPLLPAKLPCATT